MSTPDQLSVRTFTLGERIIALILIILSVWFVTEIAKMIRWPVEPGFSASIFYSPHPLAAFAIIIAGTLVCLLAGSLVLGRAQHEAGLLLASCGLASLASQAGTVGAAIRSANNPRIYIAFTIDMVALVAVIAAAWGYLRFFAARQTKDRPRRANLLAATVIQLFVTGLLLLLFARNDELKQVMTSVFFAAFIGAIIAHESAPVSSSLPFWLGTMLTGIVGFIEAIARPGSWPMGIPANPLANVPPLGYASLGTAGALLGYWMSAGWKAADAKRKESQPE